MTKIGDRTVLPPTKIPAADLRLLAEMLDDDAVSLVGADGIEHLVPAEVRQVLAQAVLSLAAGRAVTVGAAGTVLTTQEAAEFLGVSRPTLVKLLEDGKIAFTQPGRHRRVQLSDLLEYQRGIKRTRRSALAALAREAGEKDEYRAVDSFTRTR